MSRDERSESVALPWLVLDLRDLISVKTELSTRLKTLRDQTIPTTEWSGMPHSHHSHSGQFCKHAAGLLEDVVVEAVRQGFEVYGLTEHVPRYRNEDLYPEEVTISVGLVVSY